MSELHAAAGFSDLVPSEPTAEGRGAAAEAERSTDEMAPDPEPGAG